LVGLWKWSKKGNGQEGDDWRGKNNSALSEGLSFVYAEGRGDFVREIEAYVFWRWGKNGPVVGLLGVGVGWLSGSFEGHPWPL